MVSLSSMAIIIRPTPPGTGVSADARATTGRAGRRSGLQDEREEVRADAGVNDRVQRSYPLPTTRALSTTRARASGARHTEPLEAHRARCAWTTKVCRVDAEAGCGCHLSCHLQRSLPGGSIAARRAYSAGRRSPRSWTQCVRPSSGGTAATRAATGSPSRARSHALRTSSIAGGWGRKRHLTPTVPPEALGPAPKVREQSNDYFE